MLLLDAATRSSSSHNVTSCEPWSSSAKACFKHIQAKLKCDAFLVAVGDPAGIQSDEILATQGFTPAAVARSLGSAGSLDRITAGFGHQGSLTTVRGDKGVPAWLSDFHSLVVGVLEPHQDRRAWWLVLGRKSSIFTTNDREQAVVLLRQWQCEYVAPTEVGLGRVLLGHDDRLILPDLGIRENLLREPRLVDELVINLKLVLEQRVPALKEEQTHDFVATIGGRDRWVMFRRRAVMPGSTQWYLELRPSAEDELPAVGLIDDERIAAAVAFMHDHYAETPPLVQIAKHVHMSPFHFHRLFARLIGVTPKQYLMRRQMQISKWLLRAARVPIGSIAARTGFASHGHFTSTFHRLIGISPTEYRATHSGR